jgi:hypothetical protein
MPPPTTDHHREISFFLLQIVLGLANAAGLWHIQEPLIPSALHHGATNT